MRYALTFALGLALGRWTRRPTTLRVAIVDDEPFDVLGDDEDVDVDDRVEQSAPTIVGTSHGYVPTFPQVG